MRFQPFFLILIFLLAAPFSFADSSPEKVAALTQEAARLQSFDQRELAIQKYEEARRLAPQDPDILRALGILYFETQQYDKAIEVLKISLTFEEQNSGAYYYLAQAEAASGFVREAESAYRKALELDSAMSDAEYGLGLLLEGRGALDEAVERYRSVLAKNPNHAGAYFQLGAMAYRRGDLREARDDFEQATYMNPGLVSAFYNLGLVERELKNYERAREAFKQAISLDPSNPVFFYQAALTYEAQGFLEDALAGYEEALRLKPDFREAEERLQSVKENLAGVHEMESGGGRAEKTIPIFSGAFGGGGFRADSPLDAFQGAGTDSGNVANPQSLLLQAGTALIQQWINSRSTQNEPEAGGESSS